ncbi:tRNA-dihydrouridine(16/17) synthase [NAD(P)(+)]-like protein [Saguinus oedipus]|uniref:tRNA-dihydrouridine(16/17) synthase [NAD(P)(+)] n=1 Tax=Saguinus oedipus TaxID=9490 RepID=A0ABQ9VEH2_SAGOE|nr:tRNA-dihydrouridine(16/17) synthase [NAD(P)(+)]-like protein [Saguinus oedipus]
MVAEPWAWLRPQRGTPDVSKAREGRAWDTGGRRPQSQRHATDTAGPGDMPKLHGFEFWSHTLLGARHVSELAWKLLSRRHGAQLCYTPMLHAQGFVCNANYQKENLYCEVCPEDWPLIVQFCANDPKVFVQAALLAQNYCDAIDLNLGCPQMIAKRGHYGAFLQDEWNLLQRIILLAHKKLSVPVICKICVFPEIDKTVR